MRKAAAAVAMILLAAGCGGSGSSDPASAETCRDLADVNIGILNQMIDEMAGWSEERVGEAMDSFDLPEELAAFQDDIDEFNERYDELDCDAEDFEQLICDVLGDLDVGDAAGRMIRDGLAEGC